MESGFAQIKKMLISRLETQGVEKCLIPGLLKMMASALFSRPHMNRHLVNQQMKFLGWRDYDLDEHTFQLAKACFEAEGLDSDKSPPAKWFTRKFVVGDCV
jgi:hypothetical protein